MTLQPRVPVYIVIGRITAVVGLGFALAIGILLLLGGIFTWGFGFLLAGVPFAAMLFLIERAPGGSEGKNVESDAEQG